MPHRFISELKDGEHISQKFIVYEVARRTSRTGTPYTVLTLGDRTGRIKAILWERAADEITEDSIVELDGVVEEFEGETRIKAETLRGAEESDTTLSLLLPCSERDADELLQKIRSLIMDVKDANLKSLSEAFLGDEEFMEKFVRAPASYSMHHAYLGGLLEHTHDVTRMMKALSIIYPNTDSDLMVVGAFLHDIGKVEQYSYRRSIGYTTEGRLIGHIILGSEMLSKRVERFRDFPKGIYLKLKHMILSHHGTNEWGSPIEPMFTEAALLHYADLADSRVNMFREAEKHSQDGEEWTPYSRSLRRQVYLG